MENYPCERVVLYIKRELEWSKMVHNFFLKLFFLILLNFLGALAANKVQERREKSQSEIGKRKRELEEKERNTYKRVYIGASTKSKSIPSKNDVPSEKPAVKSERSKNIVMWNEDGLEFTNSSAVKIEKRDKSTDSVTKPNSKGKSSSVLNRKIKFVSSSKHSSTVNSYSDG